MNCKITDKSTPCRPSFFKEGVAHTMLNFPIGVAWKIGEVKLFSYVEKTLKTYVFIAYF